MNHKQKPKNALFQSNFSRPVIVDRKGLTCIFFIKKTVVKNVMVNGSNIKISPRFSSIFRPSKFKVLFQMLGSAE